MRGMLVIYCYIVLDTPNKEADAPSDVITNLMYVVADTFVLFASFLSLSGECLQDVNSIHHHNDSQNQRETRKFEPKQVDSNATVVKKAHCPQIRWKKPKAGIQVRWCVGSKEHLIA